MKADSATPEVGKEVGNQAEPLSGQPHFPTGPGRLRRGRLNSPGRGIDRALNNLVDAFRDFSIC
jgi:hypothetical protein